VKADGILGVILDVTGTLAAVQDESSRTIFMVAVPEDERADLAPGLTVEVTGSMKDGILRAHSVRVSGGDPWPEAAGIQESADRIQHVLFLLQVINKVETHCNRDTCNFLLYNTVAS